MAIFRVVTHEGTEDIEADDYDFKDGYIHLMDRDGYLAAFAPGSWKSIRNLASVQVPAQTN